MHDPVFRVLRCSGEFLTARQIADLAGTGASTSAVLARLGQLAQDFELEIASAHGEPGYRLGAFKAFLGQRTTLVTYVSRPAGRPSADLREVPARCSAAAACGQRRSTALLKFLL